jgi:hypothetical protein
MAHLPFGQSVEQAQQCATPRIGVRGIRRSEYQSSHEPISGWITQPAGSITIRYDPITVFLTHFRPDRAGQSRMGPMTLLHIVAP